MSYHGAYCKGPYVVAGDRREAFSPDQLDRIAACRSDIEPRDSAHLPDVCANLGGDSDQDGICDGDDNCPSVLNTCQADSDDDGFGDACDCPGAGPNGGDLDGDGIPDECDADRDGDGCYNDPPEDDHPDQARLLERTFVQVGCGSGSKSTYVSDVADTDGDGIINCMDHDDDNDGLCEVAGPDCTAIGDPCPEVPGSFCITPVADAPCAPIWTYCGAPCVEHYIRFHDLINPDPTAELRFESVWVVNDTLFAAPLLGHSAAENSAVIAALAGGALGGRALISGVQATRGGGRGGGAARRRRTLASRRRRGVFGRSHRAISARSAHVWRPREWRPAALEAPHGRPRSSGSARDLGCSGHRDRSGRGAGSGRRFRRCRTRRGAARPAARPLGVRRQRADSTPEHARLREQRRDRSGDADASEAPPGPGRASVRS
jgi:hypothetical protein